MQGTHADAIRRETTLTEQVMQLSSFGARFTTILGLVGTQVAEREVRRIYRLSSPPHVRTGRSLSLGYVVRTARRDHLALYTALVDQVLALQGIRSDVVEAMLAVWRTHLGEERKRPGNRESIDFDVFATTVVGVRAGMLEMITCGACGAPNLGLPGGLLPRCLVCKQCHTPHEWMPYQVGAVRGPVLGVSQALQEDQDASSLSNKRRRRAAA